MKKSEAIKQAETLSKKRPKVRRKREPFQKEFDALNRDLKKARKNPEYFEHVKCSAEIYG